MRKINCRLLQIVVVLLMLSISAMPALAAESVPRPVQDILDEIQKQQGVANTEAIDPQKVTQNQLETLGDAVMEVIIGDRAMHEQMDAQLGGEGSSSLANFHRQLGYRYLTGASTSMMGGWGGRFGTGWSGVTGATNNGVSGPVVWFLLGSIALFVLSLIALAVTALVLSNRRRPQRTR